MKTSASAFLILILATQTAFHAAATPVVDKSDFLLQAQRFFQNRAHATAAENYLEVRASGKNKKGQPCEAALSISLNAGSPQDVYLKIKQQKDDSGETQTGEAGIYASDKENVLKTFAINENEINYHGVNKVDLDAVIGGGNHFPTLSMTFTANVVLDEKGAIKSARIREALFGTVGRTSICMME